MKHLAKRIHGFDSSDFRRAIRLQESLKDPVDLSVGIPEELTPSHIKQAGIKAINENKTTYVPTNGILELRQLVAQKLKTENKLPATADNVTIVPGLTTGVLLVFLALLDPGDEVIVNDPYYPTYAQLASVIGAKAVIVDTDDDFRLDIDVIEKKITSRTKMILINSPNNPTGAVYSKKLLSDLVDLAKAKDIFIVSDEIYEHFIYDQKHFSVGSIYKNTITMNGFSKEYAMTGWRLGYLHAPKELIIALDELQQYVVFSSSSIAQHAAVEAFKKRSKLLEKYKTKRDFAIKELTSMGYEIKGAGGAFYLFLKTPKNMSDVNFVAKAASHNLILIPGKPFTKRANYFRLSYGASMEHLKKGIEIIKTIS